MGGLPEAHCRHFPVTGGWRLFCAPRVVGPVSAHPEPVAPFPLILNLLKDGKDGKDGKK